ncbi:MAG: hypothetical protein U5K69_16220 [Balneolaceae bacterium]|nr:hypothetical protein [Balneolaceae bacterium]
MPHGSLSEDGMHRTLTEIAKKGNLNQQMVGGRIRAELPFGLVGASGYYTSFDVPIYGASAAYNRYDFSGRSTSSIGVDYKFLFGSHPAVGEVARTRNGGYGLISGIERSLSAHTDFALAYRNYQKNFQSIYGAGFGEQSGEPQNERGVYLGLRHELSSNILLSAYFDQFVFPAPRFGTHQPTQGYDWLGLVEVNLSEDLQFYIQGRSEVEDDEYEIPDDFGRTRRKLGSSFRSSLRAQFEYLVNSKVRLRTRGEIVRARQAGASSKPGYLF